MDDSTFILAVDKNQKNLEILSSFLEKEGYRVNTANTINQLKNKINEDKNLDLVILDISGFDTRIWILCEKLRKKKIPFIVLSPTQSTMIREESFNRGANGFMVKPLVTKEFLNIVQNLIGR